MDTLNQSILAALVALISVLVAAIRFAGRLIDQMIALWARKQIAAFEAHLPNTWQRVIRQAAIFGAQAAEQAGLALRITETADAKKQYAVAAAERWLKSQGYTVDLHLLGDAIEQVILLGLHLPSAETHVSAAPPK